MHAVAATIDRSADYPPAAAGGRDGAISLSNLGRTEFAAALGAMRRFTDERDDTTTDEISLIDLSSSLRCRAIRSTVSAPNRSVAYSSPHSHSSSFA